MRTDHLNAYRALEATLRCGSQRAAADDLNVTPAAIAQHIRTLEDILGTPLFARTANGLQPSEAARAVADDLRTAFETLSRVREHLMRDASDTSRGASWLSIFDAGILAALGRFCRQPTHDHDTHH